MKITINKVKMKQDELQKKVQEAEAYLKRTDHKFLVGYVPKEGEDLGYIKSKRDEAREFVRENDKR